MNPRLRVLVMAALMAAHVVLLLANVVVARWVRVPYSVEDDFLGWYCAVLLSQASLLALWNCWGERAFSKHALWATPLMLLVGALLLNAVPSYYLARRTVRLLCVLYVLHTAIVHAAFWTARAWRGWRLAGGRSLPDAPANLPPFGRRQAVGWFLVLTALLTGGRWLVEFSGGPAPQWPREAGVPVLLSGNLLLVALAVWAAFVQDSGLPWLALASLLAMVLTAAEVVSFSLVRVQPLLNEVFIWSLNGWQFVVFFGSLLVIRGCGYRLQP